jgi:hypothetical protein
VHPQEILDMHSSSPNFNCETTYSSPPLNTVIGVRAEEVNIADPHQPVIFLTGSGFHQEDCTSLKRANWAQDKPKATAGRPRALSPAALERVLTLHRAGLGYRAISSELRTAGIDVNWSTVRRAVKGQSPYIRS